MRTQFRLGQYQTWAEVSEVGKEYDLKFGFNEPIKNEIKMAMEGARWNPDNKSWVAPTSHRNKFVLDMLLGKNPFARYDRPLISDHPTWSEMYAHQVLATRFCMTRRYAILAAEMGAGKTLISARLLEWFRELYAGDYEMWFIGPKTPNISVRLDYIKWKAKVIPRWFTLDEMKKMCKGWPAGQQVPRVVIGDEFSKFRSKESQQSECMKWLADRVRDRWGEDGMFIGMSGSPAPKSPVDWWNLCEIVCPGFIREGSPSKFLNRLAVVKKMEGKGGVAFPKVLGWKDSTNKCDVCARLRDHEVHDLSVFQQVNYSASDKDAENQLHTFAPCVNEVGNLAKRLDGLVLTIFKKDCLDLPEMVFHKTHCPPTKYTMSLAKALKKTAPSPAVALGLMNQLSSGFQYYDKPDGMDPCDPCSSSGKIDDKICHHCGGNKGLKRFKTVSVPLDCPKFPALLEWLEVCEETTGRVIICGAFTDLIDKLVAEVVKAKWNFVRKDGRGWQTDLKLKTPEDMIMAFQRMSKDPPEKLAMIGHPKSMGMGLTLTESQHVIYFNNSVDAEDRIQSMARIHRPGCRGANIVDLIHLPVDEYISTMIDKKLDLQAVTMGDLEKLTELQGD